MQIQFPIVLGGSGIENGNNGSHDLTSNNDEITIFADQRKIDFVLVTTTNTDIFVINYCFSPVSTYEGTISGQIDIGEVQPITSLRLDTIDYSSPRDQVLINTEISQNGSDWFAGNERSGLRYNFQGSEPRDSYCFRYIKYQIKFKTESSDPSESVKLRGINIYGGDTCGTELPFDPGSVSNLGTACSNGLDDDGDGKIDYSINEGVTSKNGDPGCTNLMDDSEEDAEKICQDGTKGNITLTMDIGEHIDSSGVDMGKNIYVGADEKPKTSPATIQLVSDGVVVRDKSLQEKTDGLSIYRGEGYFYIHNEGQLSKITQLRGNFSINGAKIVKAINLDYEIASGEDSYSIPDQDTDNMGSFFTKARPDSDGVYVYYEYDSAIAGGCQCQDGVDNDNNGFIDYPDDFGCTSKLDDLEARSDDQAERNPSCKNGLDDDGDSLIDYPDDPGCESIIDNSEDESQKVCKINDSNVTMKFLDVKTANTGLGDIHDTYYVGGGIYKSNENIPLVSDGIAEIDDTIEKFVPGVSIKRGPGYIYLVFLNDVDARGYEYFHGKLQIEGAKIIKAINGAHRFSSLSPFYIAGPFESQGDNIADSTGTNSLQDEFTVYSDDSDNYVEITTTTGSGSDSVYIYYDYADEVIGGCQCQDGIDNDGDGFVDYPNDPGCTSPEDNDEVNTIAALISQPAKILPSLVSSGPGFWILIVTVLVISGIVIFIIIKSDKNKPIN